MKNEKSGTRRAKESIPDMMRKAQDKISRKSSEVEASCKATGCQCLSCKRYTLFCCCEGKHRRLRCPDEDDYNPSIRCPDFEPIEPERVNQEETVIIAFDGRGHPTVRVSTCFHGKSSDTAFVFGGNSVSGEDLCEAIQQIINRDLKIARD